MKAESDPPMNTTGHYLKSIEDLLIISQNLCLARSLEEITKIVLASVREITNSDGANFILLDYGFSYYVDENAIAPLCKGQRFPINFDIAGSVMLSGKTSIIEDISNDNKNIRHFYQETFVKSMVIVPICRQQAIGAIATYWSYQHQATTEEVKLLELLAKSTAIAMENVDIYSQLEHKLSDRTTALEAANLRLQQEIQKSQTMAAEIRRLSLTDELTGLHNRRGFFLLAEQQLRLGKRSRIETQLMFFEINRIAEIKAKFGDEISDNVIVAVGKLLKRSFRGSDTLGRISEDEFVVLVQGQNLVCDVIEERVKANLDQFNQTQNLPFPIHLNIGIQHYNYNSNISLEDLIKLAHVHVYERHEI
jgi:diguanylate cyclase (GGDEF)-like protein